MRVIKDAQPDPVPAVMRELPVGTNGQNQFPHPAEHLRSGGAGPKVGSGGREDPVEPVVDVCHLGVDTGNVRAARVGPVTVSAHADVSDHRLARPSPRHPPDAPPTPSPSPLPAP